MPCPFRNTTSCGSRSWVTVTTASVDCPTTARTTLSAPSSWGLPWWRPSREWGVWQGGAPGACCLALAVEKQAFHWSDQMPGNLLEVWDKVQPSPWEVRTWLLHSLWPCLSAFGDIILSTQVAFVKIITLLHVLLRSPLPGNSPLFLFSHHDPLRQIRAGIALPMST